MNHKTLILLISLLLSGLNSYGASPTGTLPVMTITTENNSPITSKQVYLKATYTINPYDNEDIEASSGTLQIRGRGNYTWDWFEKKPYKLKLDEKAPLLGFKKSKHFVLLAHADDNLGFLREPMGFKMSELSGLAWTPGQKPVELILNGDYRGLYFLVENIRIDKDRVNIFDQEDEDPSTDVTGGWLCELDNYDEPASEQIKITESNGNIIRITHHGPEEINTEQENYLRQQMVALDKAFYIQDPDSREFENLVDLKSLVAFYVIQELLDGQESFHGSCYLHRDRGEDQKWVWGPVWDFGNTYLRSEGKMIYENPDWGQTWIDQIVKFKSFQDSYKTRFKDFLNNEYDEIIQYIFEYAEIIKEAAVSDAKRWPNYGNPDVMAKAKEIWNTLKRRIIFLGSRWDIETNMIPDVYLRGDFNNWNADIYRQFEIIDENTYVFSGESFEGRFKIADYGWNPHNWGTAIVNQEIPLDTPVELINGPESKDMVSPGGFESVIFKIIEPGYKATVELRSGDSGKVSTEKDNLFNIRVEGSEISVNEGFISVYDIAGRCVGKDVTRVNVTPGIYIVFNGIHRKKVYVK